MRYWISLFSWLMTTLALLAQSNWPAQLEQMPLPADAPLLNRDNCAEILLQAFRPSDTVKALIFLPSVADDFYLINRGRKLDLRVGDLRAAIEALTNTTAVRVTFRAPFLLLHTERDTLESVLQVKHSRTARRLKQQRHLPHALFNDQHWEQLQPILMHTLGLDVRPAADATAAWHFARPSFAGWHLTDWELVTATALAGKVWVSIGKGRVVFAAGTPPSRGSSR